MSNEAEVTSSNSLSPLMWTRQKKKKCESGELSMFEERQMAQLIPWQRRQLGLLWTKFGWKNLLFVFQTFVYL
jgi:hypothetical protein